MGDRKPPRSDGDERQVLLALLHYQRESVVRKVEGLDDEAARQSPVASGTNLLWLVRHLAHAEATWVIDRFAGETPDEHGPGPGADADTDTLSDAVAAYRATWARVDAIVARSPLDGRCQRAPDGPPTNLRWVLSHLLEETARHAGHADILRELIDGQTGR